MIEFVKQVLQGVSFDKELFRKELKKNLSLISPNEIVENWDGTSGVRVAEVTEQPFEIAPPLYWVDCDDACVADEWYFNTEINECIPKPIQPEPTE